MNKLYQTEWHRIPFTDFASISSFELPSASFYESFYKAFFEKYKNWEELDDEWKKHKMRIAEFIYNRIVAVKADKTLSIGCGIGIIEKFLIDKGYNNLELTEISSIPLRWIRPFVSPEKIHIGYFPNCLPSDNRYDFIFLSDVDYCFNDFQLIEFLKDVKKRIAPHGTCLLISTAFISPRNTIKRRNYFVNLIKKGASVLNSFKRIRTNNQQFWGYLRNKTEIHHAMVSAGFSSMRDGVIENDISKTIA
jgi:hypothetical protein